MNKENYSAEGLKERGHGVIEESRWKDFDEMVDNNSESWFGLRYVTGVIDICEIMHDESLPLEKRRRKAYDLFQEQDHNGCSAHMTMDALRYLCTDGKTLADEIADFKYDPDGSLSERRKYREFMEPVWERERKIRENEMNHRKVHEYTRVDGSENELGTVPVYTTNSGMFLIEFPYRYTIEQSLELLGLIRIRFGLCYGIFNNVPMFSFDTYETFFRRQHNGMTLEDYSDFIDALSSTHHDIDKATKILKERTWKHLGKK